MNEEAFQRLNSDIDRLRELMGKVSTVPVFFKVLTLIEIGHQAARKQYGLTSPYKQGLFLLGQALQSREPESPGDLDETEWVSVWELLERIFMAYAWMYFEKPPDYKGSHEEWRSHTGVAMPTFLNYFFSGDMTTVEQLRDRVRETLVPFDEPLAAEIGITATDAIAIADWILESLQATLDVVSRGRAAYSSLVEDCAREGWSEGRFRAEARGNADVVALRQNLFNIYRVQLAELVGVFGEARANAFWSAFLSSRGDLAQFRFPTEQNPFELAPLVEVADDEARLPAINTLYSAILARFTTVISSGSSREAFLKNRDNALETVVENVISGFYGPGASCYRNVFEQSDAQFEHDLVVLAGDHVVVAESKASPPREPFRDPRRAYTRFKRAFGSDTGIQHGFDQANRLVLRLTRGETVTLFDGKGSEIATIDGTQLETAHAVVITANNYGPLATDLTLLLEKEAKHLYPWVVNVYDLEAFLEGLQLKGWGPVELHRYMSERTRLNGKVFTVDELEIAGVFLKHGTLKEFEKVKGDRVALDPAMATVFDEIYIEKKGGPKAQLEATAPVSFTDLRHELETQIGSHVEQRPARSRKVGRNKPCPCGSGKKFKKCCGP